MKSQCILLVHAQQQYGPYTLSISPSLWFHLVTFSCTYIVLSLKQIHYIMWWNSRLLHKSFFIIHHAYLIQPNKTLLSFKFHWAPSEKKPTVHKFEDTTSYNQLLQGTQTTLIAAGRTPWNRNPVVQKGLSWYNQLVRFNHWLHEKDSRKEIW
jgi:hypothetical protein